MSRNQRDGAGQLGLAPHRALHALFALISSVAILWVAYRSVVPSPAAPISYAPAIVVGWFVVGVFVLLVMKLIGRERWLLRAGSAANE
jgi:hypothetical protein